MSFRVVEVKKRTHMEAFLAVAPLVYGEGNVPPSLSSNATRLRFSPLANPVLQHVRYKNFVALDGDRPVGRITASVDSLNPRPEEGFWGSFECIDDVDVAGELLRAAGKWLRENGKKIMIGPATLNTNEQVGLLIRGFEHKPQEEIPYNPPYYQHLIEEAGLEKVHDLECFRWQLPASLPPRLERAKEPAGLRIRSVNYRALLREAKFLQEVNNKAMARIWGFIPMTLGDARGFLLGVSNRIPASLFMLVEVDRKPAGMFISIPYQAPGQDGTGGKIRLAIGGVVPEFQHRGIHWFILKEFYDRCRKMGFTEGEASQIAESNEVIKRRIIKPVFGGELIKLYRVYSRKLS